MSYTFCLVCAVGIIDDRFEVRRDFIRHRLKDTEFFGDATHTNSKYRDPRARDRKTYWQQKVRSIQEQVERVEHDFEVGGDVTFRKSLLRFGDDRTYVEYLQKGRGRPNYPQMRWPGRECEIRFGRCVTQVCESSRGDRFTLGPMVWPVQR